MLGDASGSEPERLFLWRRGDIERPGTLPDFTILGDADGKNRCVRGIADPWLAVFTPKRPNNMAALVIPGGAYSVVMMDNEGYEVAAWLAEQGYHAFVLFYRLPGEGWADRARVPLADAQRAMRVIRGQAERCGFDAERVLAIGFSAGGHLCATLATCHARPAYPAFDRLDGLPARPWLSALVYPVITMSGPHALPVCQQLLLGDVHEEARHAAGAHNNVGRDTPDHFIVHAEDDGLVAVEHSLLFRDALRKRSIAVSTHLFPEGGHGFGLQRMADPSLALWPELMTRWVAAATERLAVREREAACG
ncbi:alpha/beta hydrolase [Sphingomonas sp.]|uniref:alpha/beta hydrolase n=1 Tax=Sphingomonas sp. TaxID=28214 RepID=UPI0025FCBFAE|nr:alpha/beta hydrolase [Sphingomonas sp.]